MRFYQRARADLTHLPTLQGPASASARAGRWNMVLAPDRGGGARAPVRRPQVELLRAQGDIYLSRFRRPAGRPDLLRRALEPARRRGSGPQRGPRGAGGRRRRDGSPGPGARAARHEAEPGLGA
ncbi:MAG: hypothetical protein R3F43_11545 [bacterium]